MRYFLSYPKSGRTWVRFMLDAYLCRTRGMACDNVFQVEKLLGDEYPVEWTHITAAMIQRLPYHRTGSFDRGHLRRSTVILLTRSVLPTLASAYHQAVYRIRVFQGTPSEFIHDGRYGVLKIATFYNLWGELAHRLKRRLVIRYEEMLREPAAEFKRVLEFLELEIVDEEIAEVVRMSSLQNMKRLATSEAYQGSVIAAKDADNPASEKIRTGGDDGALIRLRRREPFHVLKG
ncbi:MAG: sulfotransferase domain-containing protein, partial [Phycisphaerales bacterium JB038]